MTRENIVTLTAEQRAIIEPHLDACARAERGLRLALVAAVPEAREAGAQLDVSRMQVFRVTAPPRLAGTSTPERIKLNGHGK